MMEKSQLPKKSFASLKNCPTTSAQSLIPKSSAIRLQISHDHWTCSVPSPKRLNPLCLSCRRPRLTVNHRERTPRWKSSRMHHAPRAWPSTMWSSRRVPRKKRIWTGQGRPAHRSSLRSCQPRRRGRTPTHEHVSQSEFAIERTHRVLSDANQYRTASRARARSHLAAAFLRKGPSQLKRRKSMKNSQKSHAISTSAQEFYATPSWSHPTRWKKHFKAPSSPFTPTQGTPSWHLSSWENHSKARHTGSHPPPESRRRRNKSLWKWQSPFPREVVKLCAHPLKHPAVKRPTSLRYHQNPMLCWKAMWQIRRASWRHDQRDPSSRTPTTAWRAQIPRFQSIPPTRRNRTKQKAKIFRSQSPVKSSESLRRKPAELQQRKPPRETSERRYFKIPRWTIIEKLWKVLIKLLYTRMKL